jgi:hypothetical protein
LKKRARMTELGAQLRPRNKEGFDAPHRLTKAREAESAQLAATKDAYYTSSSRVRPRTPSASPTTTLELLSRLFAV